MSDQAAAASGGGTKGSGNDNADDRKGKKIAEDITDALLSSSDGENDRQDDQAGDIKDSKPTPRRTLDGLASLEASLPMKRGLSGYYDGRSKSFANLRELRMEDAKDFGKKDHAVNKRRRLLLAHQYHYDNTQLGGTDSATPRASSMPSSFSSDRRHEQEEDDEEDGNEARESYILIRNREESRDYSK